MAESLVLDAPVAEALAAEQEPRRGRDAVGGSEDEVVELAQVGGRGENALFGRGEVVCGVEVELVYEAMG